LAARARPHRCQELRPGGDDLATAKRDVVESRDELLCDLYVGTSGSRCERLGRHHQRSREALGVVLVANDAPGRSDVDRVAVEAQRGDEAPLGVVGLEHLYV
jgi:hypothetical protein